MSGRTMQVWLNGDQHVLRDEEIDTAFEIGEQADTFAEAWQALDEWLEDREK